MHTRLGTLLQICASEETRLPKPETVTSDQVFPAFKGSMSYSPGACRPEAVADVANVNLVHTCHGKTVPQAHLPHGSGATGQICSGGRHALNPHGQWCEGRALLAPALADACEHRGAVRARNNARTWLTDSDWHTTRASTKWFFPPRLGERPSCFVVLGRYKLRLCVHDAGFGTVSSLKRWDL